MFYHPVRLVPQACRVRLSAETLQHQCKVIRSAIQVVISTLYFTYYCNVQYLRMIFLSCFIVVVANINFFFFLVMWFMLFDLGYVSSNYLQYNVTLFCNVIANGLYYIQYFISFVMAYTFNLFLKFFGNYQRLKFGFVYTYVQQV